MSFNPKVITKTRIFDRLKIKNNEEFTIPETAALFCSGGGFFCNGIVIGCNTSCTPGALRSINNKLQFRQLEKWVTVANINECECKENSIITFGECGELKDTNILIEDDNIV